MNKTTIRKTKTKNKKNLSAVPNQNDSCEIAQNEIEAKNAAAATEQNASKDEDEFQRKIDEATEKLFLQAEAEEFFPKDYQTTVPINSLESSVGYSSLLRQMHRTFVEQVAYYRSHAGGSLSIADARAAAFHTCTDGEAALKIFDQMMRLPLESLNFVDLMELRSYSPRVAEAFWERAKLEGRKEFESGHLAANITFPVKYMKGLWNIARYIGVRESFIDDWNPIGGIEVALIDMMAQSYFQWQYWLEQTVKRSETPERIEEQEYSKWIARREKEEQVNGWGEGYWYRPYVSERQAIEHAVLMADRFNRIFMRTLRQLRDLRRYSPVTINNPNQVNIAADGGQQVNVSRQDSANDRERIDLN